MKRLALFAVSAALLVGVFASSAQAGHHRRAAAPLACGVISVVIPADGSDETLTFPDGFTTQADAQNVLVDIGGWYDTHPGECASVSVDLQFSPGPGW